MYTTCFTCLYAVFSMSMTTSLASIYEFFKFYTQYSLSFIHIAIKDPKTNDTIREYIPYWGRSSFTYSLFKAFSSFVELSEELSGLISLLTLVVVSLIVMKLNENFEAS